MNKIVRLLWRAALLAAFPAFAAAVIVDSVPLSLERPEIESVLYIPGTSGGGLAPAYTSSFDYGVHTILLPGTIGPLPNERPSFFIPYAEAYLAAKTTPSGGYVLHAIQENQSNVLIVLKASPSGGHGRQGLVSYGAADVFRVDLKTWEAEHKRRRIIGKLADIDAHLVGLLLHNHGLAAHSALARFYAAGRDVSAVRPATTQDLGDVRFLSASDLDALVRDAYRPLSRRAGAQYPDRDIREIERWAPRMSEIFLHDPYIRQTRNLSMRFVCADLLARLLRARENGGWSSDMDRFLVELAADADHPYIGRLKDAYEARVPERDFALKRLEELAR